MQERGVGPVADFSADAQIRGSPVAREVPVGFNPPAGVPWAVSSASVREMAGDPDETQADAGWAAVLGRFQTAPAGDGLDWVTGPPEIHAIRVAR